MIPSTDTTIYFRPRQRWVQPDPPLLPVWLFRTLIVSVFAVIYGLMALGLYVLYQILFG